MTPVLRGGVVAAALWLAVSGCQREPTSDVTAAAGASGGADAGTGTGSDPLADIKPAYAVTAASIAEANLDHSVGRARQIHLGIPADVAAARAFVSVLQTRAKFRHTFADLDEALSAARIVAERSPEDAGAHLLLADVQTALHELTLARASLETARANGASVDALARQQASIDVMAGVPERAVPVLAAAVEADASYANLSALAVAVAATGDAVRADALLVRALEAYGDVSPYAVAWVLHQRGEVASATDPAAARRFYEAALDYLPGYVGAGVRLAELDAGNGDRDAAIARLTALVPQTPDPDVPAVLAGLLREAGREAEAAPHIEAARAGFEQLLQRHELAFADHGAEFLAGPGADPARALALAQRNLANRDTPRARELVVLATSAVAAATASTGAADVR